MRLRKLVSGAVHTSPSNEDGMWLCLLAPFSLLTILKSRRLTQMSAGIAYRILFPPAAGSLMLIPSCQSPDSSGPIWSPASRLGVRRWPRWIREEARSSSQPVGPFPTASSSLFGLTSLHSSLNLLHPVRQMCLWLSETCCFVPALCAAGPSRPFCCPASSTRLSRRSLRLSSLEKPPSSPASVSLSFGWLNTLPMNSPQHTSHCAGAPDSDLSSIRIQSLGQCQAVLTLSSGLHVVLGGVGLGVSL